MPLRLFGQAKADCVRLCFHSSSSSAAFDLTPDWRATLGWPSSSALIFHLHLIFPSSRGQNELETNGSPPYSLFTPQHWCAGPIDFIPSCHKLLNDALIFQPPSKPKTHLLSSRSATWYFDFIFLFPKAEILKTRQLFSLVLGDVLIFVPVITALGFTSTNW